MKILRYSLILVFLTTISAFAQNYQTINSSRIMYYEYQNSTQNINIQCIRIDSVKCPGDSILYPFNVFCQIGNKCYLPNYSSWIGKSVSISKDGINTFVNKDGDSIRINTKANLGDKWIAYQLSDSMTIEASITEFDTLTFLGLTDSVKTISFQAYDNNMAAIDIPLNKMHLQISKNYGFVKITNFYFFPNLKVNYSNDVEDGYFLVGLSNPKVGVQNLTWADVYDFQVGDELHILTDALCVDANLNSGTMSTEKEIFKYIERKDFADRIEYKYSRLKSVSTGIITHGKTTNTYNYFNDTLSLIITPNSDFDKLPGEVIINSDNQNEFYSYYFRTETLLSNSHLCKIKPNWGDWYFKHQDSCLGRVIADGCLANKEYYKGLGGPYHSCNEWPCMGWNKRELVYYKKGDITYGTKLDVVSKVDTKDIENIKIFPNPAYDKINISNPNFSFDNYDATIYDVLGNVVKQSKIHATDSNINIEDIGSGIYMLILSNSHGVIKSEKIIIE